MKNSTLKDRPWDAKAPDGIPSHGVRRVFKGGYVRFAKDVWRDERLKAYEGSDVWVHSPDYWLTEVSISFPYLTDFLFTIKHTKKTGHQSGSRQEGGR